MSYVTSGHKGLEAVQVKDWDKAIDLLTKALSESDSPAWLLGRAHAYQEKKMHAEALADAEHAYTSASKRQSPKSQEHRILAQYRRGVILGHMKRYADADACCVWSQQLCDGKNFRKEKDDVSTNVDADGDYLATPEHASSVARKQAAGDAMAMALGGGDKTGHPALWSRAQMWRSMMLGAMQKLPKGDPGRKITVLRVPAEPAEAAKKSAGNKKAEAGSTAPKPAPSAAVAAPATVASSPAPKDLRVDFYQTSESVSLNLYAKGLDKSNLEVDVYESKVHLSNLPQSVFGATSLVLDLDGRVDTHLGKTVRVTPFKIEITLRKSPGGEKWAIWGKQRWETPVEAKRDESAPDAPKPTSASASASKSPVDPTATSGEAPATQGKGASGKAAAPLTYPSSSRTGPKNWDKLVEVEDDAQEDVNDFFKNLYANSTPEQQRAMQKSFIESNGTTLSTDWSSVGSQKVPTQPPDGAEAKDW